MSKADLQKKTVSNLFWRFLERTGAQGVSFIVSIVLARLLEPEEYGAVTLVMILITILTVFINFGMSTSLIQKKDPDDTDYSTAFYANMVVTVVFYLAVFLLAPVISGFYDNPRLTPVFRVLGLLLPITGLKSIQQAYVSKNMQFKKFFYATLAGTLLGGAAGIFAAMKGAGLWALVVQTLVKEIVDAIVLWFTVTWRPRLLFSWQRLRSLFSYGWKLLVSSLIEVGYNNLRQLIIGKVYTTQALAFYNRGENMPGMIVTNINSSFDSVLFPAIASVQDDHHAVKGMMRRAIRTSTYVMLPLMLGLALVAEPLVRLLMTEKWLDAVPFLQVFCGVYLFYPIHTANLQAIKAIGRSDIFLKLEIVKKIVGLLLLFLSVPHGPFAMALSMLALTVICTFINAFPNSRLLSYSPREQLADVLPSLGLGLLMAVVVFLLGLLPLSDLLMIALQVVGGAMSYVLVSHLFHSEDYAYLKATLLGFLKGRAHRKAQKGDTP